MAGKRQHYVPRFLQRGFLDAEPSSAERTWHHRRGVDAKRVSIDAVGVESWFYSRLSKDGSKTSDDAITALETGLGLDVNLMRRAPVLTVLDPKVAARVVTHLTLRTAHMRSVFEQGMAQIVDEMSGLLVDTARLRESIGIDGADLEGSAANIVEEMIEATPLGALPRPLAQRLARFHLRESFDELAKDISPAIAQALDGLTKQLTSVVRDAHNTALTNVDQRGWQEQLAELTWRTYAVNGAILPDCVALAQAAAEAFVPILLREHQLEDVVVLPIAHDRLLVGSRQETVRIEIEEINRSSALCSDAFFISSTGQGFDDLADAIGQRCAQVIEDSVKEAVSELKHLRPTQKRALATEDLAIEVPAFEQFEVALNCVGFADIETTDRLASLVKAILKEMSLVLPLSKLCGVTFAEDYPTALEALDRGDPSLPAERSSPRDYGYAVAKCVLVVRDGAQKQHLVLESGIAMGLLSDDVSHRSQSLQILVSMLAHVAHSAKYEVQLQEEAIVPVDVVTGRLHPSVAAAPGSYFAARTSAFADPHSGERYAKLARESLACAVEAIQAARTEYQVDDSIDKLLNAGLTFHLFSDTLRNGLATRTACHLTHLFMATGCPKNSGQPVFISGSTCTDAICVACTTSQDISNGATSMLCPGMLSACSGTCSYFPGRSQPVGCT